MSKTTTTILKCDRCGKEHEHGKPWDPDYEWDGTNAMHRPEQYQAIALHNIEGIEYGPPIEGGDLCPECQLALDAWMRELR